MTMVGMRAPDFSLADSDGKMVSQAGLLGSKVILYFYPKDDTPGCTTEACAFRDNRESLEGLGAVILGVSPDDEASHRKFSDKLQLPFALLADTDHALCEAYGVWQERSMYGKTFMGVVRSTFLIDEEGTIVGEYRKVKVEGHVEAVLAALEAGTP